jgi:hypothetical protein
LIGHTRRTLTLARVLLLLLVIRSHISQIFLAAALVVIKAFVRNWFGINFMVRVIAVVRKVEIKKG